MQLQTGLEGNMFGTANNLLLIWIPGRPDPLLQRGPLNDTVLQFQNLKSILEKKEYCHIGTIILVW